MQPDRSYHLYTHANGFENLFKSNENYRYFLKRYDHFIPSVADTLAWCLMPNHINFLARIKTQAEPRAAYSLKHPEKELPVEETLQGLGTLEEFNSPVRSSFQLLYPGL